MTNNIKTLHITVALPASGKSTWATEFHKAELRKAKTNLVELDLLGKLWKTNNYKETMAHEAFKKVLMYPTVILDGLFLTEKDVERVLTVITDKGIKVDSVVLHLWNVDRDACIWNDLYRRDMASSITISSAEVDDFNNEQLGRLRDKFDCAFSRKRQTIYLKEPWEVFATRHNLYYSERGIVKGEGWSGGGTWCNCWGDEGEIDAEPHPEYMDELFNVLKTITDDNVEATKLHTELFDYTVDVDYDFEHDYYGGSEKWCWYELYVKTLYDELVKRNLIEAEVYV